MTDETFAKTLKTVETKNSHKATSFQVAIFWAVLKSIGHIIVNAVAGSGKTSTLMDVLHFIPLSLRVLTVAFNKHIATELDRRIAAAHIHNATACTLHSVALKVLSGGRFIKMNADKTKNLMFNLAGYQDMKDEAKKTFCKLLTPGSRIISLYKNFGFGVLRPFATMEDMVELAIKYDVVLPDNIQTFYEFTTTVFKAGIAQTTIIDYDDMLFMPIYLRKDFPQYDIVIVDESQDLNPIQIEIVAELTRKGGRAIFVGDRNQAIYGFRGADPEAMDTIKTKFDAQELPLSICFRCPKSIIAAAKEIVPQIEASPTADEGVIRNIDIDRLESEVASGDYVLCRVTAPLAGHCLKLIRAGRKAIVRGRDIGQNLTVMLEKIQHIYPTPVTLADAINDYSNIELAKLANKPGRESLYITMSDKLATLAVLSDGCNTYADMRMRINTIFSDFDAGVVFSTVHKAKGLEAARVFVLRPDLMPHPLARQPWQKQQESNLKYVTITRAMRELVWVTGEDKNPTPDKSAQNQGA